MIIKTIKNTVIASPTQSGEAISIIIAGVPFIVIELILLTISQLRNEHHYSNGISSKIIKKIVV
jgi:hypothetical protein